MAPRPPADPVAHRLLAGRPSRPAHTARAARRTARRRHLLQPLPTVRSRPRTPRSSRPWRRSASTRAPRTPSARPSPPARPRTRERLLPPTVVCWGASPPAALAGLPTGTRLRITTEQGETRAAAEQLPPGVHTLHATAPDGRTAEAHLVAARPAARAARTHVRTSRPALLPPLPALLGHGRPSATSPNSPRAGRALGTGTVQVNPLHAAVPGTPTNPPRPALLPPASRPGPSAGRGHPRVRPRRRPGPGRDAAGARRAAARIRAPQGCVDRPRRRVGAQARSAGTGARSVAQPADAPPTSTSSPRRARRWRTTPPGARSPRCTAPSGSGGRWACVTPRSPATARARGELMDRVDFHSRLAWLTDAQLATAQRSARDAGMAVGLVHDLAVGVHPGGADAWAQQEYFAAGMSVGAPGRLQRTRPGLGPAALAPGPPRRLGLRPVPPPPARPPPPRGRPAHRPCDGPVPALVGAAGTAAHRGHVRPLRRRGDARDPDPGGLAGRGPGDRRGPRHGQPGVRETLHERGVLGTSVLWFERDWDGDGKPLPERWRPDCLATATTHDLPPTASRLTGDHVELRDRLGLLTGSLEDEPDRGHGGHGGVAGAARPPRAAARGGRRAAGGVGGGRDPGRAPLPAAHPGPHDRRVAPGHGRRPASAEPAGHVGPVPELAAAHRRRRGPPGDPGGTGGLAPAVRADRRAAGTVPRVAVDVTASGAMAAGAMAAGAMAGVRVGVRVGVAERVSGRERGVRAGVRPPYGTRARDSFRCFATFAPSTKTPCAPAPWLPVRR